MSVVYVPSEKCPTCPFINLCEEEKCCPISGEAPDKTVDIWGVLRRFAKQGVIEDTAQVQHSL